MLDNRACDVEVMDLDNINVHRATFCKCGTTAVDCERTGIQLPRRKKAANTPAPRNIPTFKNVLCE